MRYIAFNTFKPSPAWQQRADDATTQLLTKTTWEEKLAFIKAHAEIWRDFGRELISHFGSKCWYTDAANYGARLDVEHFRPKAHTIEITSEDFADADNPLLLKLAAPKREGYWWLAFDPEHLLLCAQVMNREEKRNFFPLHKDSPVASGDTRNVWRNEMPVFLDPRKLEDVGLVTYDDNGAMRPRSGLAPWDSLRVEVTNECFGLSRFQPLTEGRQRMWQKCTELMEQYLQAAKKQLNEAAPNPVLQQEKQDALLGIHKLLDPNEAFASVAASCLINSPYVWAKALATQPYQHLPSPTASRTH